DRRSGGRTQSILDWDPFPRTLSDDRRDAAKPMKILRFPVRTVRATAVAGRLRELQGLLEEDRNRQTRLAAERERLRTSLDRRANLGGDFGGGTDRRRRPAGRLRLGRAGPPPPPR